MTKCSVTNEPDGYFTNYDKSIIIICSNSNCEIMDNDTYCSNNHFGVIYKEGLNKFCYYSEEISMQEEKKYYDLTNVSADLAFPIISYGSDIILIEISQYSVKQFTTSSSECNIITYILLLRYNIT